MRSPITLALCAVLLAVAAAEEPKTFKRYGAALAASNAKFVFPVASKLSGADAGSFAAVDLSAMTTPDLRLEGTPSRALGASLRAFTQPPCVGRGPFVFQRPGWAYRLPGDGGGDAKPSNFTWSVIPEAGGDKKARALTEAVPVGSAVALWPGLTSYTLNDGCAAVFIVLVTTGDGDALVLPLQSYREAGPAADPLARSGDGGDGATWVDADCAKRCGVKAVASKAAAPAPAAKGG